MNLVVGHATPAPGIPAMNEMAINTVYQLEKMSAQLPQKDILTQHTFHAGMYARTILIPADTILTGALIKIATLIILSGDVLVYVGESSKPIHLTGFKVIAAQAGRKQVFLTKSDTYVTMIFPTKVDNIKDAEEEFTDEAHMLLSRRQECQAP